MTLQDLIDKYLHEEADYDHFFDGQCVDLIRYYIRDVLKYPQPYPTPTYEFRGAADFWENFSTVSSLKDFYKKIPNDSNLLVKEGDIAIFNRKTGDGDGHISIVTQDSQDRSHFYSFDQNWTKLSYCEIVKHTYTNLYGVLRPVKYISNNNDSDQKDTMDSQLKRVLSHYNVKDVNELMNMVDEQLKFLKSEREKNANLEKEVNLLQMEINQLSQNNNRLKMNGRSIKYKIGDKEYTDNYKVAE